MANTYTLDYDASTDFDEIALIHFATPVPCIELARDLDRLYNLCLTRHGDLHLSDHDWPVYRHVDELLCLEYVLIDVPDGIAMPMVEAGDKLLIITGSEARHTADTIDDEFKSSQPRTDIAYADERFAVIAHYQQQSKPYRMALPPVNQIVFSERDAQRVDSHNWGRLRGSASLAALIARLLDELDIVLSLEARRESDRMKHLMDWSKGTF